MESSKKVIKAILSILLILLVGTIGYFIGVNPYRIASSQPDNEKALKISVIVGEGNSYINSDDLNGNYENSIALYYLSDVLIDIDGEQIKLKNAIRDGLISVEEIIAYARIDARNGNCFERYTSEHGLTRFTFFYPDFDLSVVHDVYETPDGNQHLIKSISFYSRNKSYDISHGYMDDTSKYFYSLDREDWGIEFSVTDVNSTGISLSCVQSKGQQIGDLYTISYRVCSVKTGNWITDVNSGNFDFILDPPTEIQRESTTKMSFDWTNSFGQLEPGEYILSLWIEDIYEPSQVHPLMDNFHDEQKYNIEFSIP